MKEYKLEEVSEGMRKSLGEFDSVRNDLMSQGLIRPRFGAMRAVGTLTQMGEPKEDPGQPNEPRRTSSLSSQGAKYVMPSTHTMKRETASSGSRLGTHSQTDYSVSLTLGADNIPAGADLVVEWMSSQQKRGR